MLGGIDTKINTAITKIACENANTNEGDIYNFIIDILIFNGFKPCTKSCKLPQYLTSQIKNIRLKSAYSNNDIYIYITRPQIKNITHPFSEIKKKYGERTNEGQEGYNPDLLIIRAQNGFDPILFFIEDKINTAKGTVVPNILIKKDMLPMSIYKIDNIYYAYIILGKGLLGTDGKYLASFKEKSNVYTQTVDSIILNGHIDIDSQNILKACIYYNKKTRQFMTRKEVEEDFVKYFFCCLNIKYNEQQKYTLNISSSLEIKIPF